MWMRDESLLSVVGEAGRDIQSCRAIYRLQVTSGRHVICIKVQARAI